MWIIICTCVFIEFIESDSEDCYGMLCFVRNVHTSNILVRGVHFFKMKNLTVFKSPIIIKTTAIISVKT